MASVWTSNHWWATCFWMDSSCRWSIYRLLWLARGPAKDLADEKLSSRLCLWREYPQCCVYLCCSLEVTFRIIVTPYDRYNVSDHHQINSFFQQIFHGYDKENIKSSTLLTLCEGNSPVTEGFPSQRNGDGGTFLCHDDIIHGDYFTVAV